MTPGYPDPTQRRPAKSVWPFVIMAVVGPILTLVSFVVMQVAFTAASGGCSETLLFQIVRFLFFVVWLASVVVTIVGAIGAIVRPVR